MTCLLFESEFIFSLNIAIQARVLLLIRNLRCLVNLFLHDQNLPGFVFSNLPDLHQLLLNFLCLLLPPLSLHPTGHLSLAGLLRYLPRLHPMLS
jgi:hypothetical protein